MDLHCAPQSHALYLHGVSHATSTHNLTSYIYCRTHDISTLCATVYRIISAHVSLTHIYRSHVNYLYTHSHILYVLSHTLYLHTACNSLTHVIYTLPHTSYISARTLTHNIYCVTHYIYTLHATVSHKISTRCLTYYTYPHTLSHIIYTVAHMMSTHHVPQSHTYTQPHTRHISTHTLTHNIYILCATAHAVNVNLYVIWHTTTRSLSYGTLWHTTCNTF